jgi:hypothetical protein
MKTLYEAANGVEAHMILNLLQQQEINGQVVGEFLQGGVGELPATGLVRVMVAETDYAAAKQIIDKWDTAQPAQVDSQPPNKSVSRFAVFLVGLCIGVLGTYAYFHAPVSRHGIDHNGDGELDDKWTYALSGLPLKNEVDRNLDGKIDYVATYGEGGAIEASILDDDFDGVFESKAIYRQGNAYRMETDTDGDKFFDFKTNFASGILVSTEYIYPTTGLPQKVEHYRLGKLIYAETDIDLDGKFDKRTNYDHLGNISSSSDLK